MDWLDDAKNDLAASVTEYDDNEDDTATLLIARAQACALIALVERLDKLIEMGTEYGIAQLDLLARS